MKLGDIKEKLFGFAVSAQTIATGSVQVDESKLGFKIPSLGDILTFGIRIIFVIGGLLALVFLLLGAISWITSGGDKDAVDKARSKITSALIGVILIAVMLAIVVTLEQVVFNRAVCLGLSCPITVPSLLQTCTDGCILSPTPLPSIPPEATPSATLAPSATPSAVVTLFPLSPDAGAL